MEQLEPKRHNQAYEDQERALKEREKIMRTLIVENTQTKPASILDIGCADGLFLQALSQKLDCANIHGVEPDEALAQAARNREYRATGTHFYPNDILDLLNGNDFLAGNQYDVIVTSGLLAMFENKDEIVRVLTSYLAPNGFLFSFDSVLSYPVDIHYFVRPLDSNEWGIERFLFSIDHQESIFKNHLKDVKVQRFQMPFDLERKSNPYSTYSVKKEDGSRMIVTNFNLVTEQAFFYGTNPK